MEIRMFRKSFFQIILLALPGFLLAAFLMCMFCIYVFMYDWSWYTGMLFGTIISTTDPGAVWGLLKDTGETWLEVSGVFPLIAMSIIVSAARPTLSPDVETHIKRFWQVLSYIANTLVFVLVGWIITQNAVQHSEIHDWFMVLAIYCLSFVMR
ncbi:hypothetical protein LSH36_878g01036 [Paralvinella palmiformis]|uniref:Cation/H+ exchanger transmembrane domain-containing protein n=1 Tax=Paralvinella palmiformis TaxID=53620 RepID=A0AAD9IY58_9ANNE|nr:hypothetical protein LSH36_878g01036 [Paralvinella palmiformis]